MELAASRDSLDLPRNSKGKRKRGKARASSYQTRFTVEILREEIG